MRVMSKIIPRSLGAKLLSVYLSGVALVILLTFIVLEYQNYRVKVLELIDRLNDYTLHQSSILSFPLWSFSLPSINAIIDTISEDQDVLFVEVRDDRNDILAQFPKDHVLVAEPKFVKEIPIMHVSFGEATQIGSVLIAFHEKELLNTIKSRLWTDVLIMVICLAAVAFFTTVMTRLIIVKPLKILLASMHSAKLNIRPEPIKWNTNDEFGEVVHSYNMLLTSQEETKIALEAVNATLHDEVSERKRMGEDLRRALIDAEHANRAKSEFLATMSHELRTPLNAISGFSEMMLGQYFGSLGSEKYSEYAGDIRNSSQHLLQLVNDILDLSTIEAGKQKIDLENILIADVIADCAPIISGMANTKAIHFDVLYDSDVRPIFADRRALKQILLNLLSNAVKYTPEEGTVALSIKVIDDNHRIRVSDTGIGVPLDKIDSLTEPFTQIKGNAYLAKDGSGLGLSIVKSLVELHHGTLSISSEAGNGLAVDVLLPVRGSAHCHPERISLTS